MLAEFESGSDFNVFIGVYFYLLNNTHKNPIYSIHLNEEVVCVVGKIKAQLIIRIDTGGCVKTDCKDPAEPQPCERGLIPIQGESLNAKDFLTDCFHCID